MNRTDFDSLATLLRPRPDGGARAHAMTFMVQTDLFVAAPSHSYATVEAFETFALGVMPLVDQATLEHVAERLAPCAETPPAVIAAMLAQGGTVATVIAAKLSKIAPADMIAIADHGDEAMALGLAQRGDLVTDVVGYLVARDRPHIDLALAANRAIRIDDPSARHLAGRARHSPPLADALLRRDDVEPAVKAGLFHRAPLAMRHALLQALAPAARLVPPPPPASTEMLSQLVAAARSRHEETFRQHLADALRIDPGDVAIILSDATGESLAMALITMGMRDGDAAAVFLSREPAIAHSVERVFALVDRVRLVDRAVAALVTAAILGRLSLPGRTGTHLPQSDSAERPAIPGLPIGRPVAATTPSSQTTRTANGG